MDITFNKLRQKDVINIFDGKKLGRIMDISFDSLSGSILGFVCPGDKKLFKRSEDLFIPVENIKKIGEDVILIKIPLENNVLNQDLPKYKSTVKNTNVYARYRKVIEKEK